MSKNPEPVILPPKVSMAESTIKVPETKFKLSVTDKAVWRTYTKLFVPPVRISRVLTGTVDLNQNPEDCANVDPSLPMITFPPVKLAFVLIISTSLFLAGNPEVLALKFGIFIRPPVILKTALPEIFKVF